MSLAFTDAAISILRESVLDPSATVGCELLSGAVIWSDERFMDFLRACSIGGRNYAKEFFAYRTSLLIGKPREELRPPWDEALARCPEWIGFRSDRITFDPKWQTFVDEEMDKY